MLRADCSSLFKLLDYARESRLRGDSQQAKSSVSMFWKASDFEPFSNQLERNEKRSLVD